MTSTFNRRDLLSAGLGLAVGGAAIGAGSMRPAYGDEANKIVVRCWGGVFQAALDKVASPYTSATGVGILNDTGGASASTVSILQQKPGQYDLAWLIGNEAVQGMMAGVLEPIDPSKIEKWSTIAKRLSDGQTKDGKISGVPISYGASGILYNTKKVPFKITSWKDLWRPELKGQIALQNAPSIGGLMLIYAGARLFGNGPTDYEAGWAAIEKLKDNVQFLYNVSTDGVVKLAAGSVAVVVSIADQGIPLKSWGIETVIPAEGGPWSVQNLTVPAASTKKDKAYDFINYMLKDEGQTIWSREAKVAPSSTTLTLPADVAANLVETPQVATNLWPIDWYEFGQNIPGMDDPVAEDIRFVTNTTSDDMTARQKRGAWREWLLPAPLLIFVLLTFLYPALSVIRTSFVNGEALNGGGFTLDHFISFFSDSLYLKALVNTLMIAVLTVLIAGALGLVYAYQLTTHPGLRQLQLALLIAPLLVNGVVRIFGLQLGLISLDNLLLWIGLAKSPLGLNYSFAGIIVALVMFQFPFMAIAIYGSLSRLDTTLVEAAQTLGANQFSVMLRVIFPLAVPGLVAGSVITFAAAAGSFVIPSMMGGGKVNTVPEMIYNSASEFLSWATASAFAVVLAVILLVPILLGGRFGTRQTAGTR